MTDLLIRRRTFVGVYQDNCGPFLQNPKETHEKITAEIDAGKLIPDMLHG